MTYVNNAYLSQLFHNSGYDVGLVLLGVERQSQVDWDALETEMPDPFVWYDWKTGRVISLPTRDCREVTITDQKDLQKWCVRVYPLVEPWSVK